MSAVCQENHLGIVRLTSVSGAIAGLDMGVYVTFWTLCVAALMLLVVNRYITQQEEEEEEEVGRRSWLSRLRCLPEQVYSLVGSLPEAFSLPIVGNLSLLRGLPHLAVTRMVATYGKIFKLNAGGDRVFVILNDIDVIREAMTRYATPLSGKPQSTTTRMTNTGAQRDMGKRWARRRHITMSAFKSFFRECPDQIHDVCDEELTSLVRTLRQSCPEGHEPTKDITYFVARTMWRLIYGQGRQPDASTRQRLRVLSTKIDDYTKNSGPFSLLDRYPLLKKLFSGSMTRYRDAVQFMNQFCDDCDAERRAHGQSDVSRDLMTYMMRGARTLTPEDERDLGLNEDLLYSGVADLIRAGTESPSLLLLWVCLLLAKYPDVQSRMYDELEYYRQPEVDIQTICEASADRMPYSHAVVYETIRYCSIVPFLKRRCLNDVIVGGHRLPAGTNIIINNHAISHDTCRWTDPDRFSPERFLDESGSFDASRLELFLPFGIGKRRCMGEEIGKLLPFAAISTLVLNFRITAPEPIDLTPAFGITLTPKKQPLIFAPHIRVIQTQPAC